jgi:anti-sigma B factor antagonist
VDLQISIREFGEVTILDLQGRATIGDDSDLLSGYLQRLVDDGAQKLLVNLANVTRLDSWGISAIIGTHISLSRQGGSVKLLCPPGRVQAVLRVIRLPDIIPTFEDEAQALASFRPQGFSARR